MYILYSFSFNWKTNNRSLVVSNLIHLFRKQVPKIKFAYRLNINKINSNIKCYHIEG